MTTRRKVLGGAASAVALGGGAALLGQSPSFAAAQRESLDWLFGQFAGYGRGRAVPTPAELLQLPLYEQLALMRRNGRGRVSPIELTDASLRRIARVNPRINAVVHVATEKARAAARASEERYRSGEPHLLDGGTTLFKDLFDFWEGVPNTFGSKVMRDFDFVPPFTSIYVQRMLNAGLVPLGKTNTPEFGNMGITDNLVYGPTSTPFDPRFNAGGSSGGAAAALAAFLCGVTQGSDAGGSVRIPAAMTNTVALKPSVGRWPQDAPPFADAPFFTPGPMTRSVADLALLMQAVAGFYAGDPLSKDGKLDYVSAFRRGRTGAKPLNGMVIGYSRDLDIFPVEPAVTQVVEAALAAFTAAGATVKPVKVGFDKIEVTDVGGTNRRPLTSQYFAEAWVALQSGLYGHARDLFPSLGIPIDLRDHLAELTPQLRAMLERSLTQSAEYYRHFNFLRAEVLHALNAVLRGGSNPNKGCDFIVTPTVAVAGVPNNKHGLTVGPSQVNGVPTDPQIGWCLTYPMNFSGHPALTLPAGFTTNPLGGNDLPVGLQIVGAPGDDDGLITVGAAYEKQRPWYHKYPA